MLRRLRHPHRPRRPPAGGRWRAAARHRGGGPAPQPAHGDEPARHPAGRRRLPAAGHRTTAGAHRADSGCRQTPGGDRRRGYAGTAGRGHGDGRRPGPVAIGTCSRCGGTRHTLRQPAGRRRHHTVASRTARRSGLCDLHLGQHRRAQGGDGQPPGHRQPAAVDARALRFWPGRALPAENRLHLRCLGVGTVPADAVRGNAGGGRARHAQGSTGADRPDPAGTGGRGAFRAVDAGGLPRRAGQRRTADAGRVLQRRGPAGPDARPLPCPHRFGAAQPVRTDRGRRGCELLGRQPRRPQRPGPHWLPGLEHGPVHPGRVPAPGGAGRDGHPVSGRAPAGRWLCGPPGPDGSALHHPSGAGPGPSGTRTAVRHR